MNKRINRIICFGLCVAIVLGLLFLATTPVKAEVQMTTSEKGIEFIKSVEGFSKYPYYDYGQYTVGYGTRCPADKYNEYKTNGISVEEAEALLKVFLEYTEGEVNAKLIDKYNLTLTQGQFDALVSFSFNIGTSWLTSSKNSALRNVILNNASEDEIVYTFGLYCHAGGKILPGLVERRLNEADMFINESYGAGQGNDYAYVYYDANNGEIDYKIHGFVIDSEFATLKTPTKANNTFVGWYTDPFDGEQVTELTKDLDGKTLFARWENADSSNKTVRVIVTGESVNIRSGPGTCYDRLGAAKRGVALDIQYVTYLTETMWGKCDLGWVALSYTNYDDAIKENNNQNNGYLENDNTQEDANQSTDWISKGVVHVDDFLRVRTGPGTSYDIVGYLKNEDKVTIIQKSSVGDMEWGMIRENQWICLDYVTITETNTQQDSSETEPDNEQNETDNIPDTPIVNPTDPEPDNSDNSSDNDNSENDSESSSDASAENTDSNNGSNDDSNNDDSTDDESNKNDESDKPENDNEQEQPTTPDNSESDNEQKEEKTMTGVVKVTDALRVRFDAGTNNNVVGYLKNGDKVTITETKDVDGAKWGKIGDNKWVCLTYVVIDEENKSDTQEKPDSQDKPADQNQNNVIVGRVNVDNFLRIRSGYGTNYSIVGYLSKNDRVEITEKKLVGSTYWGKIDKGWISMDYIIVESTNQSDKEQPKTETKTIIADCLRIRSGAGTENSIVGYLYYGNKVEILETKTAKDGTLWGRIEKGWISMAYTK